MNIKPKHPLFPKAEALAVEHGVCTPGSMALRLHTSLNVASELLSQLEAAGVVSVADARGERVVLADEVAA